MRKQDPHDKWPAFISYTRHEHDRDCAIAIENALVAAGLPPWRDEHKIQPGNRFFDDIVLALENSVCVVALLSRKSVRRPWVLGEVFTALAADKLVPVVVDEIKSVPFGIRQNLQVVPASDIDQIVAAVRTRSTLRKQEARRILGTTGVIQELSWWPSDDAAKARHQEKMIRAARKFRVARPGLRRAFERFNDPKHLHDGLSMMRRELADNGGSPDQWAALAHLAMPFHYDLALAALERGRFSENEINEHLGDRTIASVRRERLAPPETLDDDDGPPSTPSVYSSLLDQSETAPLLSSTGTNLSLSEPRWDDTLTQLAVKAEGEVWAQQFSYEPADISDDALATDLEIAPQSPGNKRVGHALAALVITATLGLLIWVAPWKRLGSNANEHMVDTGDSTTASSSTLPYCNGRACTFPRGYSLSRVAEDCFGDQVLWPVIWAANSADLPDRDPNRVYEGEAFILPERPACSAPNAPRPG